MLDPQFTPFPVLTTERLLLRAVTVDDAAAIFRIRSDQRVMRYIGKEPTTSIEDALKLIATIQLDLEANNAITWAITKKAPTR
ncbi:MAG: GNAT family N-acetyltransferase [Flavobacteriales bacterium]